MPGLTDLQVFARGGYATVYRATQVSVGREVAVKVENRTLDSERDQARFLREARAAGRMSSHPHVVDLFDVGVTVDQHPYLIMELCDGSYAERMRNSPLGAAETRDLGVKIADALAHSHAAGVLHRDVKPANILHSNFNSAVLADFGLAVLAEVRDASVTLEVLTPAYAPPEMFSHSPPRPAVDVYALCATLYAVMHGRPPRWQSERNPSLVTVLEMFHQPIPDLPGVPDRTGRRAPAGMSNDPARPPLRRSNCADLLAALPLDPPPRQRPPAPVRRRPRRRPVRPSPDGPSPRQPVEDDHPTVSHGAGAGGGAGSSAAPGCSRWPPRRAPVPGRRRARPGRRPTTARRPPVVVTGRRLGAAARLRGRGTAATLPAGARCAPRAGVLRPGAVARRPGRGEPGACDGRHTWETYAAGRAAGRAGRRRRTPRSAPTRRSARCATRRRSG